MQLVKVRLPIIFQDNSHLESMLYIASENGIVVSKVRKQRDRKVEIYVDIFEKHATEHLNFFICSISLIYILITMFQI